MGKETGRGRKTYRNPNHGRMRLDPVLVAIAEEAKCAHCACGDELDRQDGVDFANELVTDFESGFGDGTTEL